MTDLTADDFSSAHEPSAPPAKGGFWRKASWFAGSALIAWGALGLSIDRSLYEFDAAALWVGVLALPPVMDLIRRVLPIEPRAHAAGGALCIAAGLGWAILAPPERTAAHFAALSENAGALPQRWSQLPDPAVEEQKIAQAEASQTKQAFLAQLAAETARLQGGVHPASFIGNRATVMIGARALADWRALAGRAGSMDLTEAEKAQVLAFQNLLAVENLELGPALRQSYAASLRDHLSEYGVAARVAGGNAETIEFTGAALADPGAQEKLRALLGKDMALLGYKSIQFVAPAVAHAAAEPAVASASAWSPS